MINKAIDYFSLTFRPYPYTSYKLCFVDDMVLDTADTASLSLCSTRLLFPEEIIDPIDDVTRVLVHALASQWSGVYIIPKMPKDSWVVVGIAYFITDLFIKKICGNNEYRFRQKKAAVKVCGMDVSRPSLSEMGDYLDVHSSELEFMALKAPLVLFILDRRLVKNTGSSGLSRIISRIFLNASIGELANGALTALQFQRSAEKLGHLKLDAFLQQWVHGSGCPVFNVTQRFNKKKLVVEMKIDQVQSVEDWPARDIDKEAFMRDTKEELRLVYASPPQAVFTVNLAADSCVEKFADARSGTNDDSHT